MSDKIGVVADFSRMNTHHTSVPNDKNLDAPPPTGLGLDIFNKIPDLFQEHYTRACVNAKLLSDAAKAQFTDPDTAAQLEKMAKEGTASDLKGSAYIGSTTPSLYQDITSMHSKIVAKNRRRLGDCFRTMDYMKRYNAFNSAMNLAEARNSKITINSGYAASDGQVIPFVVNPRGLTVDPETGKPVQGSGGIPFDQVGNPSIGGDDGKKYKVSATDPGAFNESGTQIKGFKGSNAEAYDIARNAAINAGSPDPDTTASIMMFESGYLGSSMSQRANNPFGQTITQDQIGSNGIIGGTIGADGQLHAVYDSLESAVDDHIRRWGSKYVSGDVSATTANLVRAGYNTENKDWSSSIVLINKRFS